MGDQLKFGGGGDVLRPLYGAAGVSARIDLTVAALPGEPALVATGHAIAVIPEALSCALRTDATPVDLVDPLPAASTRPPLAATPTPA
ncbi:hypothetical protein ACFV2D_16025 [Streptomyces capillispiralis]|uniref:hypothetical protein n=1 Tax=Streptomyces capillispiralis TaxID=68182 RepID=UPI0036A4C1ED